MKSSRAPEYPPAPASTAIPPSRPAVLPDERAWVQLAWERSVARVRRTSVRVRDGFPHVGREGRYDEAPVHWWTNGFWPGLLWLVYREERDESLRAWAESCERRLDRAIWEFDGLHHDVGFMWSLTSVARYKLLGAQDSRRRALITASLLAGRFNLGGRYIRAWNADPAWPGESTGWAIIDCLMNLPLLHWASATIGDPRFRHVAVAHADTVLRHFLRPDGSSCHIVAFNPETGGAEGVLAGQGYSADSAWARGQAWALYGFALSYAYTGAERYLEAAERAAGFFLAQLPAGMIPAWDFRAPDAADGPRDSSAGACAASGLLELAALVPAARAGRYRAAGVALLQALDRQCGLWDSDSEALLGGATGDRPRNVNVNVSLIYGDYFFVEALAKLRGRRETFW